VPSRRRRDVVGVRTPVFLTPEQKLFEIIDR
jgi:hypothetical protein